MLLYPPSFVIQRRIMLPLHDVRLLDDRRHTIARVEIELSMWSNDSSELQLRPVARHPERWSGRRARRYFTRAHRGADATARLVAHRAIDATEAVERATCFTAVPAGSCR
jgi:hypothetical protein